jgi:hypothetical protein
VEAYPLVCTLPVRIFAIGATCTAALVPAIVPVLLNRSVLILSSVAVPALIVCGVNGKMRWDAHWEHEAHLPPRSERPEYAYQNIRTKNFFWGDGDKVGIHHNLRVLRELTLI